MNRLLLLILPIVLYSASPIVPDDYKIYKDKNLSYIYSSEYRDIVPSIREYQQNIINEYEDEFGFRLDDRLTVGLASQNNQIANGFSTQIPFNSQLFYSAGMGLIDYFCFDSWLRTLIIHETAHNFQVNPKESKASRFSHKVVGNTPFTMLGPFPLFPLPNYMINGFILEGNAVLNESRFGNGGRLYSGYALAELVSMAIANKIRPELMYNSTLEFPYREDKYIIGGFFQEFLAKKYGVKRVNSYFKLHSKQLFPFFTSSAFKKNFGKSFRTLLKEFVDEVKSKHKDFKSTNGKVITKSQFIVPMNSSEEEIYTLVGDFKSYPKILEFKKSTRSISFKEGAYRANKPFKIDGEYYTTSSVKISPTEIKMGLVDRDAYMRDETIGKIIQGFLPNGKAVYFDLEKSFDYPHIYIDKKFYDTSNSSVFISKKGDIYYFKQNAHKRTLYKNRKPLFSYQGHYGFVTDVKGEDIYFIALSRHGSTAYLYNGRETKRVSSGDDIIDIKLIGQREAVVATIDSSGFKYQLIDINPKISKVTPTKYPLESKKRITDMSLKSELLKSLKSEDYHPLKELRFSSLDQSMAYSSYEGIILNLKANLLDPAMQNSLSTIISADKQRLIGGLSYENMAHQLEFGGDIFGVSHNNNYDRSDEDDYGYSAHLKLPFLAKGYYRASTSLDYIKKYDSIYREPLTLSLDISNIKKFGISKYPNHLNSFDIFLSQDRENLSYGASYSWLYGLPWQSFIGIETSYLKSDNAKESIEKGIEIDDNWNELQPEKARVVMPTLDSPLYAKEAKTAEFSIYKSIDTPLYFFSFPISLQRETLYAKEKIYDIDFIDKNRKYSETTLGLESDFVFLNNFVVPLKFELLYNKDVKDKSLFRVMLGVDF